MSIWYKEAVKVNGRIMAYVEVQNDWTGQIRGRLYMINKKGYAFVDGQPLKMSSDVQMLQRHLDDIESWKRWYEKTGGKTIYDKRT